jgi:hypothetical protein
MSTAVMQFAKSENLYLKKDFDPVVAGEALAKALQFIKDKWAFSNQDIADIIKVSKSTIKNWLDDESVPVSRGPLSPEVEAFISLLGIQKSLHAMFASPAQQLEWLKTEHPELHVRPLDYITQSNENLFSLRQYLDYVRGRGV